MIPGPIRRAKPIDLPLTADAFWRFKDRLEMEGFRMLDVGRADRLMEARRDFRSYRLKVAVALSLADGPAMFGSHPVKAEAKFICMDPGGGPAKSNLAGDLISRAFPYVRHGNIALRYEELAPQGPLPAAGPYRGGEGPAVSDEIDIIHLLRAGEELMKAREEAARIVRAVLSAAEGAGRLEAGAAMGEITSRIKESRLIASAIEEHVPGV
ncbi:MAG: hypothetical protein AB1529_04425 [Candidatus Micrarchaeota archaeon]